MERFEFSFFTFAQYERRHQSPFLFISLKISARWFWIMFQQYTVGKSDRDWQCGMLWHLLENSWNILWSNYTIDLKHNRTARCWCKCIIYFSDWYHILMMDKLFYLLMILESHQIRRFWEKFSSVSIYTTQFIMSSSNNTNKCNNPFIVNKVESNQVPISIHSTFIR